jgi:surface protein
MSAKLRTWKVCLKGQLNLMEISVIGMSARHLNSTEICSWNVSSVTCISGMLAGASQFNGDLSRWDVSSVTDMDFMFQGASQFNGDLSQWDVSKVTESRNMFLEATQYQGVRW